MSAQPVLALVGPPAPGHRALQFIAWAIESFGEPSTRHGHVLVRRSQSALVAAHDSIESHGTVSWYMRQLRDAGVVVGDRPITIDLDKLHRLTGLRAHGPVCRADTTDLDQPPATGRSVAELLAQRAEQQARLAQLQAEVAITDAAIARALIATDARREPFATGRDFLATDRDSREPRSANLANQEGRKVDRDLLPSLSGSRDREFVSRVREPAVDVQALPVEEVDEIVEPVRAVCRRTGRPDRLDDRGRRQLASLGRAALTAGVEVFAQEVAADPTIRKPMGVLVSRAERDDPDTFAPRSSAPSPAGDRHSPDCDCGGTGFVPAEPEDARSDFIACRAWRPT